MKNMLIFTLIFLFSSSVIYAKVIPLDNQHPDICRQQILSASDAYPVILAYQNEKLLPLYETVAEEIQMQQPDRTFFTFDFHDPKTNTVQGTCLQQIGVIEGPSVMVLHRVLSEHDYSYYTSPIRVNSGDNMSKADLIKLVSNIKK